MVSIDRFSDKLHEQHTIAVAAGIVMQRHKTDAAAALAILSRQALDADIALLAAAEAVVQNRR